MMQQMSQELHQYRKEESRKEADERRQQQQNLVQISTMQNFFSN